jgi:hypothetical protein
MFTRDAIGYFYNEPVTAPLMFVKFRAGPWPGDLSRSTRSGHRRRV